MYMEYPVIIIIPILWQKSHLAAESINISQATAFQLYLLIWLVIFLHQFRPNLNQFICRMKREWKRI